jgi:hypothetical protein
MDHDDNETPAQNPEQWPEWVGTIQIKRATPERKEAQTKENDAADTRNKMTPYERRSVRVQWLIFSVTAVYAFFACLQWVAMNKTLEATRKGIEVSGQSLDVAKEANQINRESFVSAQRAFVTFRGAEAVARMVDPVTNKATDVELATIWENSGATPTKNMRINVNCVPRSDPLPKHFDFPDVGEPEDRPVVIGPKAMMVTSPCKVPISLLGAIQQGQMHLYFWGWVRYSDIFIATPQHVTLFCIEMTDIKISSGNDLSDPSINILVTPAMCAEHNCTDDECANRQEG